uniref:CASP-like protein n=1 Tax=Anthurium amnicola TaxID=1678845 RepID=A0A1D1YJH8_9ARAE
MKSFPGTPGTFSSLVFRIMQSLFAAGSVASMASAPGFSAYTAFCYLIVSMALQFIWSMGLACLDIYQLVKKSDLHHSILVGLFVAGDWYFLFFPLFPTGHRNVVPCSCICLSRANNPI